MGNCGFQRAVGFEIKDWLLVAAGIGVEQPAKRVVREHAQFKAPTVTGLSIGGVELALGCSDLMGCPISLHTLRWCFVVVPDFLHGSEAAVLIVIGPTGVCAEFFAYRRVPLVWG
ncbi:hypothetical protein D3C71_1106580 [compost metagenome]